MTTRRYLGHILTNGNFDYNVPRPFWGIHRLLENGKYGRIQFSLDDPTITQFLFFSEYSFASLFFTLYFVKDYYEVI